MQTTKVKDTGSAVKNVLSVIESLKKQVAMKHIVSLKVIRTYALNKTWWISFLMDIIRDIVDVKGNISAYTEISTFSCNHNFLIKKFRDLMIEFQTYSASNEIVGISITSGRAGSDELCVNRVCMYVFRMAYFMYETDFVLTRLQVEYVSMHMKLMMKRTCSVGAVIR
ncbi:unnamed protein product [Vicia faba]|uniref:Uncharacterized protein n=1 Tax=Vicia faba TaxID=3906 RepID=A0AAV0ZWS0_VICFA|nr:unnamed protein product [Vicia faba]